VTARQLRAALKRLGLSQTALGRLVEVDPRTVRGWVGGRHRVPGAIALLLAAWRRYRELIPVAAPPKRRRTR